MAKTKELESVRNNRLRNIGFKKGYSPWNKGLTKETDERVKKTSELNKGRIGTMTGKHHSKKTKDRLSIINRKRYENGYINPMKGKKRPDMSGKNNPNKKLINREKIKKRMLNGGAIKARKGNRGGPNKPEKVLIDLIKDNNLPFNYVGDGAIWFTNGKEHYNPDFLSKNPRHIIELFGDYWHNIPKSIERDEGRLTTYSKYGYKTLIIWEHELEDLHSVLKKIKLFVGELV